MSVVRCLREFPPSVRCKTGKGIRGSFGNTTWVTVELESELLILNDRGEIGREEVYEASGIYFFFFNACMRYWGSVLEKQHKQPKRYNHTLFFPVLCLMKTALACNANKLQLTSCWWLRNNRYGGEKSGRALKVKRRNRSSWELGIWWHALQVSEKEKGLCESILNACKWD